MKIPTAREIAYAKSVIGATRAFIRGRPIQRRGTYKTNGKWEDFDFGQYVRDKGIEYRAKPVNARRR